VLVTSRDPGRAAAAAEAIAAASGQATGMSLELTDPGAADALVDRALGELGGPDILVNNAGAGLFAASETLAPEDFRHIVELDLVTPFACAAAAARVMLARRDGVIVNISLLTGHVGLASRAAYSAAKHGLEGLTKALAAEWSPRGVRVVSVAPGSWPRTCWRRRWQPEASRRSRSPVARRSAGWPSPRRWPGSLPSWPPPRPPTSPARVFWWTADG
jgi:3-oxoacyl-[acyl-carrier protein] reductase